MSEDLHTDAVRPTVFLSYARADQEQAAKLAKALEAAGLNLWWDALIEGGAAFAKSIEAALDNCDAVIVVWTKAAVGSDWVPDEAAKGRDLRKLVPVSFDGTEPPIGFRQYQSISLSHWKGDPGAAEIASIVRGVRAATGHSKLIRYRAEVLLSEVSSAGADALLCVRNYRPRRSCRIKTYRCGLTTARPLGPGPRLPRRS